MRRVAVTSIVEPGELHTRCPTCKTVFRTHDAQLSVQAGKVRCGQCRMVFDGRANLVDLSPRRFEDSERLYGPPTVTLRNSVALEPAHPDEAPQRDRDLTIQEVYPPDLSRRDHESFRTDASPEATSGGSPATEARSPLSASDERPSADAATGEAPVVASLAEGHATNGITRDGIDPASVAVTATARDSADADASAATSGNGGAATSATPRHEDVVPFRWDEPAPRPLTPRMRWALAGSAGALALLLAGQMLFHFRHALAARYPDMRSPLVELCGFFGCRIEALKRREALTIESHDMQADPAHQGLLILQVTLRNHANHAVAFPYLELEVLDIGGHPQVRRALAPAEYAGGAADFARGIPPGAEWNAKLFIDASSVAARGYNLDLFYP